MKKPFILILILSLTISAVPAQKEKERVILINSGISLPFSSFAKKEMDHNAGFAGAGMNIDIDYLNNKARWLTFTASAGYAILNFKEEAYRAGYDRILNQDGAVTVTAGNYQFYKTVVGLAVIVPEFYHIELLFSAQIGAAIAIHPEISVDHIQYGVINSFSKDHEWAATSNLNMRINYNISEKYGVNLTYCLNYLTPYFYDDIGVHHVFSLPVRFGNLNLGIAIKL